MSKKKKRIPSKSSPQIPESNQPAPESNQPARCPIFEPEFRDDLKHLARTNPAAYDKVWRMIDECLDHPFTGMGKPEPLKHIGSDLWSRRITLEDRLVYRVGNAKIDFLTCRFHYS